MKRALSIVLLSVYVFSSTEMHQLLKVPVLVMHFIEHKQLSGSLTFVEFISVHYSTDVTHDAHDHELPFKDFDHCVTVQTIVMPSSKIEIQSHLVPETKTVHTSFYKPSIPSSHLSEIWQPPRI